MFILFVLVTSGAEDDEWDDEWDDVKSNAGYADSEAGDSGAMQRGGAHATSMKISLNKQVVVFLISSKLGLFNFFFI